MRYFVIQRQIRDSRKFYGISIETFFFFNFSFHILKTKIGTKKLHSSSSSHLAGFSWIKINFHIFFNLTQIFYNIFHLKYFHRFFSCTFFRCSFNFFKTVLSRKYCSFIPDELSHLNFKFYHLQIKFNTH